MAEHNNPSNGDDTGINYKPPSNPAVRIDPEVKEMLARLSAATAKSEKEVADTAIREYFQRNRSTVIEKLKILINDLESYKP